MSKQYVFKVIVRLRDINKTSPKPEEFIIMGGVIESDNPTDAITLIENRIAKRAKL